MFKFYLDNTQVTDPINWDKFEESIVRDDTLKCVLPKYEIKLTFGFDAYDYIIAQLKENGYCKLINIRVEQKCGSTYKIILNGYIFISDCIFRRSRSLVECEIIDDNYGARIYNNKAIKTYLNTSTSKNGLPIYTTPYYDIDVFAPTTAGYLADKRRVIFWYDALKFLVEFMTDGLVGFESDYLNYSILQNVKNDDANKVAICTGEELRQHAHTTNVFTSFEDLYKEINKKFPIMLTVIKGTDGRPTIKIENEDYFYNSDTSITLDNLSDVSESFYSEKLYANILFGSQTKEYDGTLYNYPNTRFFNFGEEEYYFTSECNTSTSLDLKSDFICDSNIIEGIVYTDTSNDGFDEDIFLIECSELYPTLLAKAYVSPITGSSPWFYNGNLRNNKIAERYSLSSSIALYLNNGGDGFMATKTISQTPIPSSTSSQPMSVATPYYTPVISFQDDSTAPNFDTNGNYNNTNWRYTSPANGVYGFENTMIFKLNTFSSHPTKVYMRYDVYDNLNVLQYSYYSTPITQFPTGVTGGGSTPTLTITSGAVFYVPQNYYVTAKMAFQPTADLSVLGQYVVYLSILANSTFKTTTIDNGGGIYEYKDPADYFVSKVEFDYPMSNEDYELVKADLSKGLYISNSWGGYKAWIKNTKRTLATGETKFELISNLNNQ